MGYVPSSVIEKEIDTACQILYHTIVANAFLKESVASKTIGGLVVGLGEKIRDGELVLGDIFEFKRQLVAVNKSILVVIDQSACLEP